MAFPAAGRLKIEVAIDQRSDFGFGLRQGYEVGTIIELAPGVTADYLVLPARESFGIGLINGRNTDVGSLVRVQGVNVFEVSGVESELEFFRRSDPPPQLSQFGTVVFQPFSSTP